MSLKDKLFSFEGRLRRRDWWIMTFGLSALYVLAVTLLSIVLPESVDFAPGPRIGDPVNDLLVGFAIHGPLIFVHCALATKRAHDRDKSAKLVIVLLLAITAAGYLPNDTFANLGRLADEGALWAWPLMLAGALNIAVALYLLTVLGFREGMPGPNRFGPSPKADDPVVPVRESSPAA
jgi:uncharacterized membrane protein YhaH (DUF805 family)